MEKEKSVSVETDFKELVKSVGETVEFKKHLFGVFDFKS